jgi:dephospho-CoA kinase
MSSSLSTAVAEFEEDTIDCFDFRFLRRDRKQTHIICVHEESQTQNPRVRKPHKKDKRTKGQKPKRKKMRKCDVVVKADQQKGPCFI